jgi:hypothetical protein
MTAFLEETESNALFFQDISYAGVCPDFWTVNMVEAAGQIAPIPPDGTWLIYRGKPALALFLFRV